MTKNEGIVESGVLNLTPWFWTKPKAVSLITAFCLQLQELENAIWDVLEDRILDNAEGSQLATLGRLVGESRLGRSDDDFRIAIRGRILANRSRGNLTDLLKLLELMRPDVGYSWTEGNAAISFESNSLDYSAENTVLQFLIDAKPAGVYIEIVVPATTTPLILGESALAPEIAETFGLGSTTSSVGGHLSTVIT